MASIAPTYQVVSHGKVIAYTHTLQAAKYRLLQHNERHSGDLSAYLTIHKPGEGVPRKIRLGLG